MTSFSARISRLTPFKNLASYDKYHVTVVTSPAELDDPDVLPLELRYIIAVQPGRREMLRTLLEEGFGIGVRTVDKTPERILQAVDRISHLTQHNTVVPWLEYLLREERVPVFGEEELRAAEAEGVNLYAETKLILERRFEFKKIVIVPLENQMIPTETQMRIHELNKDLIPLALDVVVNRITFDNAHTRTEVAQSIIKALFFVGPIAHALEHVLRGIGKLFAATADDILSEIAELFALRGSGFTWRQLLLRSRILIPVFILATYGAFHVETLLESGHIALAGVVFGLSAVALSLTTAIQSIQLYRISFKQLHAEGKLQVESGRGILSYALHQDFTNPARLGLFIGALASPLCAAVVFLGFPELTRNGWVLALLGSVESLVASLTVVGASRLNRWRFRRRVREAMQALS